MPPDRLVYSTRNGRSERPTPPAEPRRGDGSDAAHGGFEPGTLYVERTRKGRGGKTVTLVLNAPGDAGAKVALLARLKTACGAGGTLKQDVIEVQGDQRDRVVKLLQGLGHKVKVRGG